MPEINGLQFEFASDLVAKLAKPLSAADDSPLANAVRAQWPDAEATYHGMVVRRFSELYPLLPEEDAVKAVRAGYSSPAAAIRAKIIRKRAYRGFMD